MEHTREDLLQTVVQLMMSIMRHVRHVGPPVEPVLSPPQMHILFSIAHHKQGLSVKELAESASVTPGAITQFVDTLVEKGLVVRETDPNDRRVVRLKLTGRAKNQFEKFKTEHLASMCRVFDVLSDEEIEQLISLMTKIDTSHSTRNKNAEADQTP
jgi:DNA-binding MarR family transcriptional regulator